MRRRSITTAMAVIAAVLPLSIATASPAAALNAILEPGWQHPGSGSEWTETVAAGDFDGNGTTDVAAVTSYTGALTKIYLQDEWGRLADPLVFSPASTSYLEAADLEGDGQDELISSTSAGITIRRLVDADTLTTQVLTTRSSASFAVADLDGNGRLDVVADATGTNAGVYRYLQQLDGTWSAGDVVSTTASVADLELALIDGDARLDLVYYASNALHVELQQVDGTFGPASSIPITTGSFRRIESIAAGDLNGDGLGDLVGAGGGNKPNAWVFIAYQNPDGTWPANPVEHVTYDIPENVQVADIDHDGDDDVLMVHNGWDRISIFQQSGGAISSTYTLYTHSVTQHPPPDGTVVADVNGDGYLDVVSGARYGPLSISYNGAHNRGPTASNVTASGYANSPIQVTLNGSDPDGDPLDFTILSGPHNGTLSGTAPALTYNPGAGFVGTDTIDYVVGDGNHRYAWARATITVRPRATISGTVDDGFAPIAGAEARLYDTGGFVSSVLTAADGSYAFDDVLPGTYYLWVVDPLGRYSSEWHEEASSSLQAKAISAQSGVVTDVDVRLVPAGLADPIVVTTPTDGVAGSLRQAIGWSNAQPGPNAIALQSGTTYVLTCGAGGALISSNGPLTIDGNGATITQSCPGERIIEQLAAAELSLYDVTLRGGSHVADGGAVWAASSVLLDGAEVHDGTAGLDGGGVWSGGSVRLMAGSLINGNQAGRDGGGVYAADEVVVDGAHVVSNGAGRDGGGMWASNLDVSSVVLSGNTAARDGGGSWSSTAGVGDAPAPSMIESNTAGGAGGGLFTGDDLAIEDVELLANEAASGHGGAIRAGGTATLTDATVLDNVAAGSGGGLWAAEVIIDSSTISGNASGIDGGGAAGGIVSLLRSTIDDNSAIGVGGGIVSGVAMIDSSTVSRNSASIGGGIVAGGTSSIMNSTLADNVASSSGGGVSIDFQGGLDLRFSTLLGNAAPSGANLSFRDPGNLVVFGSVLALGIDGSDCAIGGTPVTSSYSTDGDGSCGLVADTDLPGAGDPGWGPLADNGGPTMTRSPFATSVAIDAVPLGVDGCSGSDQRGLPRPAGVACDLGAVELVGTVGPFIDVPADHPFVDAVRWAAVEGITGGWPDGTFRPTSVVTRQAAVAFLHRMAGSPLPPIDAPTFADVPPGHPFEDAVRWAAAEGITDGWPDGTFRPTGAVTRQAIVAFLHRVTTG